MKYRSRLSMLVCVVAALSFVALIPAGAGDKKHEGSHCKRQHKEGKEHKEHKKHMKAMHARCKNAGKCRGKVGAVIDQLEAAQKAIEDGDPEDAAEKLSAGIETLGQFQKRMKKMSAEATGKPVNTSCPIMGEKIDPDDTPEKLTRTFQGKTVGFCCKMCPEKWDELDDEEKEEKLKKVTE